MVLQVLPLETADFDVLISHASTSFPGDDLVGNPVPFCWPVANRSDAEARCLWHFSRQRKRYIEDTSVRFMKVIDTGKEGEKSNEIISIARWHFYESGYSYERDVRWELADGEASDGNHRALFDAALHDQILSTRDFARKFWILPPKAPCWILMHMNTRFSCQRRGAAKLLVQWGIDQAEATGIPAYLEAGVMGLKLYKDLGFQEVGDPIIINASAKMIFQMAKMAYMPSKDGGH
ncbi:hypothetical protein K461DRAFT_274506 [Myriangium duriaei CBS 260.36]|uniref:N-acetyltransferase domain-containing protein n=1 Tax=Myriangium duriaei CBS 260.36 TaxID=1168546 RepID=A0A9P4MQD5_9PEZI|nr:hypothetical protein K461DRAFT_274506 [Myriangium duriaei CBS 260.36]